MKTFNSNAKLNLKQFDEISKTFRFRNYLEHYQQQEDFIKEHPYLFDEEGNGFCEMLIIKIDTKLKQVSCQYGKGDAKASQ
jgi:uncharacterized protein (DUF2461 family)